AVYLHDAHEQIRLLGLDGAPLGDLPVPCPGSVTYKYVISLNGNPDEAEMFYIFQSFAYPVSVFRYDFSERAPERIFAPDIDFDFDACETGQVFAPSKDGTPIPMFLVHRKGIRLDGRNPTLLFGYGGFDIPVLPQFDVWRLAWLELGGVYASANLRGGSEYGQEWHKAGMLDRKQNVFDDFIACAEFLIEDGVTSTDRLAIHGGSNGGLLVGACMTQRPDLFGACIPAVGVMDMLRFHKFTIGWAWVSDYGCADDPEQFRTLYAYSPYHNLRPGTAYPATLVMTADHDDRVVPGHSFKFAAALQSAQGGDAPVLIRIQTRAGHGYGKPVAIEIEEKADMGAFLVEALGIETRALPGVQ
ncbi:MAG TPA: prolyl oligopeptidase family serine peptidase, partial [Anaerolineales bacterium]